MKIVVAGSQGRMGLMIAQLAREDAAISAVLGFDKGESSAVVKEGDVVIDFTIAAATASLLPAVVQAKKPYVIGTTGFTPAQDAQIVEASRLIPIVKSSNMSLGVNVFFKLAQEASKALPEYSIHIEETHHVHKKDSPSGTALQAGGLIQQASGKTVTYESFRKGEVIGDHRIIVKGPSDQLEIFHHAESREIFAAGAIAAAQWVVRQKPGLYSMFDVLGL